VQLVNVNSSQIVFKIKFATNADRMQMEKTLHLFG